MIKLEENISKQNDINDYNNDNDKNLKRQNSNLNLGSKSSSLYNVMNVQKNFNCFRNNNANKKAKEPKNYRNIFNGNNKIIKNNSIKVYSSMIKNEFSDLAKNEKEKEYELYKKREERPKEYNIKKKEEKKLNAITDTNIQLISINDNNIIINHINNNHLIPNTISNKVIHHVKMPKSVRKNSEQKNSQKENILFPDLKIKKTSSTKDTQLHKESDNKFIKNNLSNENKIFSQKLITPKRRRPFSSAVIKENLNKNLTNNEINTNNNVNNNNNIKRINRPLTGIRPSYNNNSNVMNININFYNIDMNRRFLAPEINPLHSNELENLKEKNILKGGAKVI